MGTDFDELFAEIEAEAAAEGEEAVLDLRAKQAKYRLINLLISSRRDLHLTQEALAQRSGVAQTEISRIERGRKSPTLDTYSRLAAALNIELPMPRRDEGEPAKVALAAEPRNGASARGLLRSSTELP